MRRVALALAALAVVVLVSGCKDKYESATDEMLGCLKEVNAVLAGVKDEASVQAAKPKLEKLGERMKTLSERVKAMEKPSKEREEQLQKKYETEMQGVMKDLMGHMMRLMSIKGAEDLQKVFEKMPSMD